MRTTGSTEVGEDEDGDRTYTLDVDVHSRSLSPSEWAAAVAAGSVDTTGWLDAAQEGAVPGINAFAYWPLEVRANSREANWGNVQKKLPMCY